MALKKDEKINMKLEFAAEDFSPVADDSIVVATDPTGAKVAIDIWCYADYFFSKIQDKSVSENMLYVDGIRIDKFKEYFVKEMKYVDFCEYLKDPTFCELQLEMNERHNTHINWVALYGLSMYVKEIINRRLVLLMKPSIRESLEEIAAGGGIASIGFNLKNGGTHTSDYSLLTDRVMNALTECQDETVGLHKIVRKVDVYTNEYGQIEFVRYMSKFFHEYFSEVRRRKNSYLTTTEQKIICYLLKFFGFSPVVVQESRFRQLYNSKYNPQGHYLPLNIPGVVESKAMVYLEFLPYSIWKQGKINPLNEKEQHQQHFLGNLKLNLGGAPGVAELLQVVEGMFGR